MRHFAAAAVLALAAGQAGAAAPASHLLASPDQMHATVKMLSSAPFEGRSPGTPGERTDGGLSGPAAEAHRPATRRAGRQLDAAGADDPHADRRWRDHDQGARRQGDVARPGARDLPDHRARRSDRIADRRRAARLRRLWRRPRPNAAGTISRASTSRARSRSSWSTIPISRRRRASRCAGKFGGRTMTYYGRWTYKFEEAARRGAVGALIVHETAGAGYGWNVVISARRRELRHRARRPAELTSLALQGWISGDAATRLFAARRAGSRRAAQRGARAATSGRSTLNGATFDADVPVTHEPVAEPQCARAHARARRVPTRPSCSARTGTPMAWARPTRRGAPIRAGANDDALGVAGVLEIARATSRPAPRPTAASSSPLWTAEERGLLGSEYYAANPVYPLEKTVANLTHRHPADRRRRRRTWCWSARARTRSRTIWRAVAATQGRTVTPEAPARTRPVLPRRPFLARQARRADAAADGVGRRAGPETRRAPPGRRGSMAIRNATIRPATRWSPTGICAAPRRTSICSMMSASNSPIPASGRRGTPVPSSSGSAKRQPISANDDATGGITPPVRQRISASASCRPAGSGDRPHRPGGGACLPRSFRNCPRTIRHGCRPRTRGCAWRGDRGRSGRG